jgi:hypothetical protein
VTTLHYGPESFVLAKTEDVDRLAAAIEAKLTAAVGGGWVEFAGADGAVSLLVSHGIPLWIDRG